MKLMVNNDIVDTDVAAGSVALDLVRSNLGLKATKEGCREGDCGACTVLVGVPEETRIRYRAVNSCLLPVGSLEGCHVVTLEGLNRPDLSPIQREIVDQGATQCGFCTPGIVVATTAFLLEATVIGRNEMVAALSGNICRCTGYSSIIRALHNLADRFSRLPSPGPLRLKELFEAGVIPEYFSTARDRVTSAVDLPGVKITTAKGIPVAGGTDLFVQRPDALLGAPIVFVRRPSGSKVVDEGEYIRVDGDATVDNLCSSPAFQTLVPDIDKVARLIASPQIRVRATVAGNIANASPIGDLSILFLALDTSVVIESSGARRELPLKNLFRGYKDLDLGPGELIKCSTVPRRTAKSGFNFEKVSKRIHMDIASVNTAMSVETDGETIIRAAISAGGVAPVPLYLKEASASVSGRPICPDTAKEAAELGAREVSPISDVRGSARYKRLLLRQLIAAHFHRIFGLEVLP